MKDPRVQARDYYMWARDARVSVEPGNHVWTYVYVSYKYTTGEGDVWVKWEERGRMRYTNEAALFVRALIKDLEKAGYSDIQVHIKE